MKKLKIVVLVVSLFLTISTVKADGEEFYFTSAGRSSEVYIGKHIGVTKTSKLCDVIYTSDNNLGYRLDNKEGIDMSVAFELYGGRNEEFLNVDLDAWNRIKKIAYFGYGWGTHTDFKWYTIAQYLIESEIVKAYIPFLTMSSGGDDYGWKWESEINEINSLVENYSLKPDFNQSTIEISENDEIELTDSQNVLGNYNLSYDQELLNVDIEGDILKISALKSGEANIVLTHKNSPDSYAPEEIYQAENGGVVLVLNGLEANTLTMNVKVIENTETNPTPTPNEPDETNPEYELPKTSVYYDIDVIIFLLVVFSIIMIKLWKKQKEE